MTLRISIISSMPRLAAYTAPGLRRAEPEDEESLLAWLTDVLERAAARRKKRRAS